MAGQVSRAVRLCGTEQVDPASGMLKARPLSVELENGALRYVRLGGPRKLEVAQLDFTAVVPNGRSIAPPTL
jgi:hypothetical protein